MVDNGSTDGTRAVAEAYGAATGQRVRCIEEPHPGKSHALNTGLAAVGTELVITLDADGSVLVRNSRDNLWTRMQEWDYFLGIASVKRMQARGMIEGIHSVRPWNQPRRLLRFLTAIDLLIPALDVAYALMWPPGLVLAATGRYWIVGPYTLAYQMLMSPDRRHRLRAGTAGTPPPLEIARTASGTRGAASPRISG